MNDALTPEVETILAELIAHVARTESAYIPLHRADRVPQPIPFFGDIGSARALTIGVNPSAEEFAPGRGWPSARMSATDLAARLRHYFEFGTAHPWFEGWMRALRAAAADSSPWAHLDLSPRATYSFGKFTLGAGANAALKQLFLRMVEHDLT